MKAVILAGGRGSRLSEETASRPKPMVEIGGKPILWHIMKLYSAHGVDDFVICLGYKGYLIKEYLANYALHTSNVTFDMGRGSVEVHSSTTEPWRVTVVETGEETMTGGRLKRVAPFLDDGPFCFTYGDGLSDVDIRALLAVPNEQGTLATPTSPPCPRSTPSGGGWRGYPRPSRRAVMARSTSKARGCTASSRSRWAT